MQADFSYMKRYWKWKSLSRVQLCDPILQGQNTRVGSLSILQGSS